LDLLNYGDALMGLLAIIDQFCLNKILMYHTTNDKENNKIIFEKIEEIQEKAQQKFIELKENFEKNPNLPFRLKIINYNLIFINWVEQFRKSLVEQFRKSLMVIILYILYIPYIVYSIVIVLFFCCCSLNYEKKWFFEWCDDIINNNPDLLPQNIENNMYNELKNFAQTLHDEYNMNVTVINYNLDETKDEKNIKNFIDLH
jgi:hypothetical protein